MANLNTNPIQFVLQNCRSAFLIAAIISLVMNLLMLTIPIYMMQLFDRVIVSQSTDTLLYLTAIALIALAIMALLDIVRGRILVKIGSWFDQELNPLLIDKSIEEYLQGNQYVAQSIADITTLRQFLSSTAITAFFDAPWVFIYLAVIFILSITLGITATLGAAAIFFIALLNERATQHPINEANQQYSGNQRFFFDALKQAESIQAMGMLSAIKKRWLSKQTQMIDLQEKTSDQSNIYLATSKFLRMGLQLAILGIGAYLVLLGEFTGGAMIAASIIVSRALAPIEQAIGGWKQFVHAQAAYYHLQAYLKNPVKRTQKIELTKPEGMLQVEHLTFLPPFEKHPVIFNINFALMPGESLAIIGPSSAGKSTLLRLLAGVWEPTEGSIRLDGSNIHDWSVEKIGEYFGYLPQESILFNTSVKDNIARLNLENEEDVLAAANYVNVHHMILKLKQSYDTPVNDYQLSGGQKQRIALARAFYKKPVVVFLDEPEKNLDQDGLIQLQAIIQKSKENKITLIYATHRMDLAACADKILILQSGQMANFGPSQQVLQSLTGKSS